MSDETVTDLRRVVLQTLESWHAAGISHLTAIAAPVESGSITSPPERTAPPEIPETSSTETIPDMGKKTAATKAKTLIDLPQEQPAGCGSERPEWKSLPRDKRVVELKLLSDKVAQCTRCSELASQRTQTVFGVGNPEAKVVFIGEAPGADEDKQGEPFVGKAGQLLNKIIEAMKLKREDIYICNVLRCRPPDNRLPEPTEAANCREFLDGQLALVNPEYIVCWGSCASQNLLGVTDSIGKMRGRFYQYGNARVLCTYHPSYLLRNPAAKKDVWNDMKILMKELGIPVE